MPRPVLDEYASVGWHGVGTGRTPRLAPAGTFLDFSNIKPAKINKVEPIEIAKKSLIKSIKKQPVFRAVFRLFFQGKPPLIFLAS